MAYIYKIINIKNNKFYIGQTKKTIDQRFSEHVKTATDTDKRHPFYDAIRSYGVENFSISMLEECSSDVLLDREMWWIEQLRPAYNLTKGGTGGDTFSKKPDYMKEETRRKLSEHAKKLWKDESYRKTQSQISKERWKDVSYRQQITRKANENVKNPQYIKKVSENVKKAIATKKDIWSECKKGSKNSRWLGRVEMYNPVGSIYKIYETAVECSKDTGIVAHIIRTKAKNGEPMLTGKFKNYTFKFIK